MDDKNTKTALRRECLSKRNNLTPEYRQTADAMIIAALRVLAEVNECINVSAFISDGFEPDLRPFLEECLSDGKNVFLPRSNGIADGYEITKIHNLTTELIPGKYGIMEPCPALPAVNLAQMRQIVWLTPLVAYDAHGTRLGRGKGVYDRLLESSNGIRIGIGYQCQKVASIPAEIHDCPLDIVVTESGTVRFNQ